ncbi:MAG: cytochrome P450 [Pseudonocardiaceae bacterium]
MSAAPRVGVDPFTCPVQSIQRKPEVHDALRKGGPIVEANAPAGGPAWVITEDSLARQVLVDPRFIKDPELAPASWHGVEDGLDFPAPELRPFTLITVDGEDHRKLRRIHGPAFNPRRLSASSERIAGITRDLLTELAQSSEQAGEPTELIGGFAYHFPLLVICDLLGVPVTDPVMVRTVISTQKAIALGTAGDEEPDPAALEKVLGQTVQAAREGGRDSMTRVLYERVCAEFGDVPDEYLIYMIIGLIFAGHDTTGSFLGFLLAHVLAGHLDPDADADAVTDFIDETLRLHPPVPYTLWRFAATDLEIAGVWLPRGAPVLIDIEGINTDSRCHRDPHTLRLDRGLSPRLTFGNGPHYCLGEQLALLESTTMIQVLRSEFPAARLAVPFEELRWGRKGAQTARLTELPAWLR